MIAKGELRRFARLPIVPVVALALAVAAIACEGVAEDAATDDADEAELLEQLSAIGYVAGTDPVEGPSGVTVHDVSAAQPGLNLVTSGHAPVALLLDMQGTVLHTWRADLGSVFPGHPKADEAAEPSRNFWRVARLLPNGDLIAIWELYGLFKLDRASQVVWALRGRAHHDLQVTPDGRIYHLEAERRQLPEIPDRRVIDDFIVERDAAGNEVNRLAISEALRHIDWLELRRAFLERSRIRGYQLTERTRFDPFHTNALRILSAAESTQLGPPFRPGDALVSMAMLDTIAVIDPRTAEVRWWQQGPFGMQHQPRVTPDGKIVVFNNHYSQQRSAVQLFDPRNHQTVWEYAGTDGDPLFSLRSGGAEPLPNGNLLVLETDRGRVLEVTRDQRVVWEYRNPYRVGARRDRVARIYSVRRIPESEVAWLER